MIKDSGKREQYSSGMVRDTSEDKLRWDLALDGPLVKRLAIHLTEGAKKYKPRNWMLACTVEEMERFRESAIRHFMQWVNGEDDEDHLIATVFNLNGYAYVLDRLQSNPFVEETK